MKRAAKLRAETNTIHNFSSEWTKNETSHWHACDGCDEVKDKAEHNYGNDNKCDDCGFKKPSEGLRYEYDEETDSYKVTGIGDCTDTKVVISEIYNDKPVTSIGNYAFGYCTSLTSIEIPNSVTSIGNNAFSSCKSLISIEIPNSVMSIGSGAFYGCESMKKVYYHGSAKEWNDIQIGADNSTLFSATVYYYSATDPKESDDYNADYNYWYYNDRGEIVVWE